MAADRIRGLVQRLYVRLLEREISATPDHVAVIQDGNRRYARERGKDKTDGHRAGAETTEAVMRWCDELGIRELTLYAFSTENFKRPQDEREALFDLIAASESVRSVRPTDCRTVCRRQSTMPRLGRKSTVVSS